MKTDRQRLIKALEEMPDEAFGWFLLACAPAAMLHGAHAQIWPDGIGGFTQASRTAIENVRAAAAEIVKGGTDGDRAVQP